MTFGLAGGARLVLAGGGRGWLWVAAGGVALLLTLALSREERRLVSRRAGLGLLGLRLLAVLVLVATLFEPIVSRPVREPGRGRVIVAVDVSASMETADPGRLPDERLRLARTPGLGPAEPAGSISRREVARRRLLGSAGSPVAGIAAEHAVEVIAFAREAAPATLASLAETLRRPSSTDDPSALTTDWEPAPAKGLSDLDTSPAVGIVLLTDGLRNAPRDPAATIDRLAAGGPRVPRRHRRDDPSARRSGRRDQGPRGGVQGGRRARGGDLEARRLRRG